MAQQQQPKENEEQQQEQQLQQQEQQDKEQQHDGTAIDCVGGFRRLQGTHSERPPLSLSYDKKEVFCIFKSSVSAQHKASQTLNPNP